MTDSRHLSETKLYAAAACDDSIVRNTTSGGIADLLAKELIRSGYFCIGVRYDNKLHRAEHVVAQSCAETDVFRGSKYIQSYSFSAFRELVNKCKEHKFAVFGTPCQIYAINRYATFRNIRDNILLIDLYCHGCPSLLLWKKYIKEFTKDCANEIDSINFRSKVCGWGNFYITADCKADSFSSTPFNNGFYDLFFSDSLLNIACNDCSLRSTLSYTDIRLGDFWGKSYATNTRGISAVSIVTTRGADLYSKITSRLSTNSEHDYSDFLPYQSYGKIYTCQTKLRDILFSQIKNPDIHISVSLHTFINSLNLRQKMIRYCKQIVHVMPVKLIALIKHIYH